MPERSTVTASKLPRYSVVIPVFNSADIVATTIRQTIAFFQRHGWSCEIIAVNDGSTDRSWDVLCDTVRTTPCLTAINLAANHGQHAATMFGLARTIGDFVVTIDDGLQQPPDEIARLVEQADRGHDLVCGRFRQTRTPVRWFGSRTIGLLDRWLFHKPHGFVFTSFRLMRREVVDRVCAYRLRDPYLRGLLVRCASRPSNAWVEHRPRPAGRSGYGAVKIARFGMTMARTYLELRRNTLPAPPPPVIEIREVVGQPWGVTSDIAGS